MGVDLRGDDAGVTEELLHRAQIAAAPKQIGGETVAQDMRVHIMQPRDSGVLLHEAPDGNALKRLAADRYKQAMVGLRLVGLDDVGALRFQPSRQRLRRRHTHGNDALFVALSDHGKRRDDRVPLVDAHRADLARAQSCRVHQLKNGAVADPKIAVIGAGGLDELAHLTGRTDIGNLAPLGRTLEEARWILGDFPVRMQETEEDAHGRDVSHRARGVEISVELAGKEADMLGEVLRGDIARTGDAAREHVANEVIEVAAVSGDGEGRQAALDADVGHEIAQRDGETRRLRGGALRRHRGAFGLTGRLGREKLHQGAGANCPTGSTFPAVEGEKWRRRAWHGPCLL